MTTARNPTLVATLTTMSMAVAAGGCGDTAAPGGAGAVPEGGTCSGAIGAIAVPDVPICAASAAFGDIFLDDSGAPLGRAILVSEAEDACLWATAQQDGAAPEAAFVKVEVFGTIPGVCPIQAGGSDPTPPAGACVARVRVRRLRDGKKLDVLATSGTVEVSDASADSIAAQVTAGFPEDPYFEEMCTGAVVGGPEPHVEATCTCVNAAGDTKQCTTDSLEGGCCNDGQGAEQTVAWTVSALRCPALCTCSAAVLSCPCF